MTGVLKLVEKQIALWNLKRRLEDLGHRPGRCLEGEVAYGPCLLMSREYGSGGVQAARLVGDCLGWHVFDREVVDQIAQLAHVRQQLMDSVDEQARSSWADNWKSELQPEDIGCETYLRYLRQVVLALGHHGDVVIVGRGAPYLLPSQCALRVQVVAPLERRAQRIAERTGMSLEDAHGDVQRCDANRADFIRKSFQRDVGAPLDYDLVINTGEISMAAAAAIIQLALREKLGVRPVK